MKSIWNKRGFTLLEILIAVSILATAFSTLLLAQGNGFLASERAERLTQATFLVRQKMVEFEITLEEDLNRNKFPDEKEEAGTFDEPFEDFRYKQTVKKVEIPLSGGGEASENALVAGYLKQVMDEISKSIREVKVVIFWGDKDLPEEEQQQLAVTTHIVKLK